MSALVEQREHEAPQWQKWDCVVNGVRLYGLYCELPGGGEKLKKIRLALFIPPDAVNVIISLVNRRVVDRERANGRPYVQDHPREEEVFTLSYFCTDLRVGKLVMVPREMAMSVGEGSPMIIQVEEFDVYSWDNFNRPTIENLG